MKSSRNLSPGSAPAVSVAIPTYGRDDVLIRTVKAVLGLEVPPAEVLVVDQTEDHDPETAAVLEEWHASGAIRWLRLRPPSIPAAMNRALLEARSDVVLFLDDDIVPMEGLVEAHALAHRQTTYGAVVGQILQPGEEPVARELEDGGPCFRSTLRREIEDVMAGNLSVDRTVALDLGGFDENFKGAAYRFESEFADRVIAAGHRILYESAAGIRHLRAERGGTRSFGEHFRTLSPGHAVGAYYYLLRSSKTDRPFGHVVRRLISSVRTRHHLSHPWWIPVTLFAEVTGMLWAILLWLRGPRMVTAGRTQ